MFIFSNSHCIYIYLFLVMVLDNAFVNGATMKNINWDYGCFVHTIYLAVIDTAKVSIIKEVTDGFKSIVIHFKYSSKATSLLLEF